MKKKERAALVLKILNKIYPDTPIPLNHKNVYELLISVLLSAQCTDKRVNQVTPLLFNKADNPYKMKDLSVDEIRVVYNEFVNVATQATITEKLLPIELNDEELSDTDYLYEPSKKKIVKSLIPRYLNAQVWKYLLESYASEQAARMVAMENATTNSEDMIKNLTRFFFPIVLLIVKIIFIIKNDRSCLLNRLFISFFNKIYWFLIFFIYLLYKV